MAMKTIKTSDAFHLIKMIAQELHTSYSLCQYMVSSRRFASLGRKVFLVMTA